MSAHKPALTKMTLQEAQRLGQRQKAGFRDTLSEILFLQSGER